MNRATSTASTASAIITVKRNDVVAERGALGRMTLIRAIRPRTPS